MTDRPTPDPWILVEHLRREVANLTLAYMDAQATIDTLERDIKSSRIPGGERDASEGAVIDIELHGGEATL